MELAIEDGLDSWSALELHADMFIQVCAQRRDVLAQLRRRKEPLRLMRKSLVRLGGVLRSDFAGCAVLSATREQETSSLEILCLNNIARATTGGKRIDPWWSGVLRGKVLQGLRRRSWRVFEFDGRDESVQLVIACKRRVRTLTYILFAAWSQDPEYAVAMHQHGGAFISLWMEAILVPILRRHASSPVVEGDKSESTVLMPNEPPQAEISGMIVHYAARGWVRDVHEAHVAVTIENTAGEARSRKRLLIKRSLFDRQGLAYQGSRFLFRMYEHGGAMISEISPDHDAAHQCSTVDQHFRHEIDSLKAAFRKKLSRRRPNHG